jgi:hypothetical protein
MIDFVNYLLTMPFLITLFALINNFVRYNSQSDFDKIFLPKHKAFWYKLINAMLLPILITPLILFISIVINNILIYVFIENLIVYTALFVYSLSLIVMFVKSDIIEPSDTQTIFNRLLESIKNIRIEVPALNFIHISSILIAVSTQLAAETHEIYIINSEVINYTTFITYFIVVYIGVLIFSLFYSIVFATFRPKKSFLIIDNNIKRDDLYVLYSLDKNTLVLGDEKLYKNCNSLFLYDLLNRTYSEFKTENTLKNDKQQE